MIERRAYGRVPFHCRATVATWPAGGEFEAWSMDLSLGGVRLAMDRELPARQAVVVTFHLRDADQNEVRERVLGQVVRRDYNLDGSAYGVEFHETLDASHHPLLLEKLDLASGT